MSTGNDFIKGHTKNNHFCVGKNDCNHTTDPEKSICRGIMLAPLVQMSKMVVENENLGEALSILLRIMKEDMGVLKGMVCLYNSRNGKIFIHDSIGLTEEEKIRGVYSVGEGITGKVVETGEAIIVPRISDESAFLDRTKSHATEEDKNRSFVCIPIMRGKKVMGALSVERLCSNLKSLKHDVDILSIIACLIAQAVELYLLENEERNSLKRENERLKDALKEKFHPSNIIGNSKPMQETYTLIDKISKTTSTVLILGESGVGKELVANAIHYNSAQANEPFVTFNCAALPESIIESELFGHEKGAFTGADKLRIGRFEQAHRGTIFIDEVGELSLSMQTKLLRVLQERVFERVGGNIQLKIDIRVVAATNRNLEKMVKEGSFREDLFYRLNVFPIMIPPLRDRGSDIITLAEHFVNVYVKQFNKEIKRISTPVQEMLFSYAWPGNVRELENVILRSVILSEDNVIHVYDLPLSLQTPTSSNTSFKVGLTKKLETVEYEVIIESLADHKGNISAAAESLGLTRRMLSLRMDKLGINYKKFRSA